MRNILAAITIGLLSFLPPPVLADENPARSAMAVADRSHVA